MTDHATTNPGASSGSDSAMDPSYTDIDNPGNLNFWEPTAVEEKNDDEANPEQEEQGIAGETDEAAQDADQEAEATAETEEQEAEEQGSEKQTDPKAADDEAIVTLKGGEQVPIKELKLGYMRERDYRIKTSELSNKSRSLEDLSNRVTSVVTTIADFLVKELPPEPTRELAMRDPGEYVRQKAMYDAAYARAAGLIDMANGPKQVVQQLTNEQKAEKLANENAQLLNYFPETGNTEGREKFFQAAFSTGNELGFSNEEMQAFDDHRYLRVIHYARLGLEAEQAKKKAMHKVTTAPAPAPTPKLRAQGQNVQQSRRNQDAMQRLGKTGSMKDALSIDFE